MLSLAGSFIRRRPGVREKEDRGSRGVVHGFVVVRASFVRRTSFAPELLGAAEEARADGRKASQRNPGKSHFLFLFHLGFCVCACREASSEK